MSGRGLGRRRRIWHRQLEPDKAGTGLGGRDHERVHLESSLGYPVRMQMWPYHPHSPNEVREGFRASEYPVCKDLIGHEARPVGLPPSKVLGADKTLYLLGADKTLYLNTDRKSRFLTQPALSVAEGFEMTIPLDSSLSVTAHSP